FSLTNKILAITTDNASNMLKFGDELKNLLQPITNHSFMHLRCAAHVLNIAVKHGLELVDHKVVVMLKKIRKSTLLTDELKKIFESKDEKFLSPIWDNSTRWNSTYLMIYRQ